MSDWTVWMKRFEGRIGRPWPSLPKPSLEKEQTIALLKSLQKFQLGETGEGRVANQVRGAGLRCGDAAYANCIRMLIAEEGRHARILGSMVRALGGESLRRHWTDGLFTQGRRLLGVRTKLLVLFVSEVVGIAYYDTLANHFPNPEFRSAFAEIKKDEELHFDFHVAFFKREFAGSSRMMLVKLGFVGVSALAGALMLWDHRSAFHALDVSPWQVAGRMRDLVKRSLSGLSETGVSGCGGEHRGSADLKHAA